MHFQDLISSQMHCRSPFPPEYPFCHPVQPLLPFSPIRTHLPKEISSPSIAVNHPLNPPKHSQRKSPRPPLLKHRPHHTSDTARNPFVQPASALLSIPPRSRLLSPCTRISSHLSSNPPPQPLSSTTHSFRQHSSHGLLSAHFPPSFKTSNHSP